MTDRCQKPHLSLKNTAAVGTIQQAKIHAHSFVLGPELRIQYMYTYVNNSEHHRF